MPCDCKPKRSKRPDILRILARAKRANVNIYQGLTADQINAVNHEWRLWARPQQLEPSTCDWRTWLIMAGRGFGKTRTGSEWVNQMAKRHPGCRIAMVAPTAADARDTMVEGVSGVLNISGSSRPLYEPSKRRLTWPNGSIATVFTAEKPDRLRGPNHHYAWCDEMCYWGPAAEMWDMLQFGLRLGDGPRCVITTTPRPIPTIREILSAPSTHKTGGSTYDNEANLAGVFIKSIAERYEGSALGRQEIHAELLDDVAGALFTRHKIEGTRVDVAPSLKRVVVAVDPSASANAGSDEAGVVVVGVDADNVYYVMQDASGVMRPNDWARRSVELYDEYSASTIVCEGNLARGMVEDIFKNIGATAPVTYRNARTRKEHRAGPVSALHEQGRLRMVGHHPRLEDQMCTWVPGETKKSPDRLDALVWAVLYLMDNVGSVSPAAVNLTAPSRFTR